MRLTSRELLKLFSPERNSNIVFPLFQRTFISRCSFSGYNFREVPRGYPWSPSINLLTKPNVSFNFLPFSFSLRFSACISSSHWTPPWRGVTSLATVASGESRRQCSPGLELIEDDASCTVEARKPGTMGQGQTPPCETLPCQRAAQRTRRRVS